MWPEKGAPGFGAQKNGEGPAKTADRGQGQGLAQGCGRSRAGSGRIWAGKIGLPEALMLAAIITLRQAEVSHRANPYHVAFVRWLLAG